MNDLKTSMPESKISDSDAQKNTGKTNRKNIEENEYSEITEVIDALPEVSRRKITAMMSATSFSGRMGHPLFEKFTDEHISKFLDYTQEDDNNAYKYKNRIFVLIYIVLCLGGFLLLTYLLLPNNRDLLVEIIKLFVVFAGGLGSGFGIKSYMVNKNS